jgi:hypothetical protein
VGFLVVPVRVLAVVAAHLHGGERVRAALGPKEDRGDDTPGSQPDIPTGGATETRDTVNTCTGFRLRLRAEGRTAKIGPGDLSLTRGEAVSLLRGAGAALTDDDVAELHRRTEGWPARLYVPALYRR